MSSIRTYLLHPIAIAVYGALGTLLSLFLGKKAKNKYRTYKSKKAIQPAVPSATPAAAPAEQAVTA